MPQTATLRRPKTGASKRGPSKSGPSRAAASKSGAKVQPPWAHGQFHWNELRTRDAERAKRFYASTIGWSFQASATPDGHTYWVALQDGRPVAGLFPLTSPMFDGVPESWMSFLAVDDVDVRVAKAVKAGAELVMPIFDVPDVGRIAMLREPGGAGIGWITPVGPQAAKGAGK
jgi:predicted enzyme related to lactoylglutathione lyase